MMSWHSYRALLIPDSGRTQSTQLFGRPATALQVGVAAARGRFPGRRVEVVVLHHQTREAVPGFSQLVDA